jgi:hypothetical protein
MIRQDFEVRPRLDIEAAVDAEWDRLTPSLGIFPGARVCGGGGKPGR